MTAPRICAVIYGILAISMMCWIVKELWSNIQRGFYYRSEDEILDVFGSIAILGIIWPITAGYFIYAWFKYRK